MTKKKKKKMGILNTLLDVVVVETHWGIAGITTSRTVVLAFHRSTAL
jgi:hypothetical protein